MSSVLLMYPYSHPIQVGWASRNAGAVASRTVSASLYNMFVQLSSVVSANIYRKDDAPMYRRGNSYLIGICLFNLIILYPGTKLYYIWRNKQKARQWDAMTPEVRRLFSGVTERLAESPLATSRLPPKHDGPWQSPPGFPFCTLRLSLRHCRVGFPISGHPAVCTIMLCFLCIFYEFRWFLSIASV